MALLQVPPNSEQAIVLNTPNRNEILKDGLPTHTKYKILGRGAFGTVFKAIYRGQPVAVKIVRNVSKANAQSMRSEMHILGWKHRNIIRILKVETTLNFGIVIMERLVGQSLQDVLEATVLPLEHRIYITLDILSALSYCHKQHLLHLDVKPQNVLISFVGVQQHLRVETLTTAFSRRQYVCKLCDFGASLKIDSPMTSPKGNARGTVRYMSPEALREEPLTAATDIYSLGITMWQMWQRRLPYHIIACNEVVAYQVVKNKLRPDSAAPTNSTNCTSVVHTNMDRDHKCYCGNLTAEEITYHSLVHLTNVLNRTKQPEEQLRFSDCSAEELHQSAARRPFASLNAKMNVMRNLNTELNCSKSPIAQKSPKNKKPIIIRQQQQRSTRGDVVDLLVLFEDILRLHDRDKEESYEAIYKACWCDEPMLRPNHLLLRKRLVELL
ncbi:PREDICTED: probable serine/threonine-protein kinase DDB_G0276181 isoform X2 [Bactrocera latifrons]|uniref:non-specific serine/threonine protein kinase n=3 Tax=Bactrocera latifrons TaxID=174628 RepID=A0A0K8U5U8_BACLA|nr:PREDICTED: probable serine/threonine-protein kinase DDB_G0276181 isoform X2 [Bactrocera latifrons]